MNANSRLQIKTLIPIVVLLAPLVLLLGIWGMLTLGTPWIRPWVQQLAGQAPASDTMREEVLAALRNHDRLDVLAHRSADGSLLRPRATGDWLAQREADLASLRTRGWYREVELLDRQVKGVYTV